MNQDINFLKSIPASSKRLSSIQIIWATISTVILLSLISIALSISSYYQKQQLASVQAQLIEATIAFQKVAKAYPLFAVEKPLVDQVSDYEKLLREKESNFAILTHETLRRPFSRYLQTLSMKVPAGLWLTAININQDTNNVSLSGYSLRPVLVSVLLQALQTEPAFAGVVFDLFYLKKNASQDYVQFEIANDKLLTHHDDTKEEAVPDDVKEKIKEEVKKLM